MYKLILLLFVSLLCVFCKNSEKKKFHFVVTADTHMYRYAKGDGKIHMGFKDSLLVYLKNGNTDGPGDFIIVAGDMDPFSRVRTAIRDVMGSDYGFYPVMGNHDVGGTNNHRNDFPENNWQNAFEIIKYNRDSLKGIVNFGPDQASPELSSTYEKDGKVYVSFYDSIGINGAKYTSYSFDHGNSHFVVLDEYATNNWGERGNGRIWPELFLWLKNDLESTDKENVFVFGHEPVWSHASLDTVPVSKKEFWNLLKNNNVIAYFCGHHHDYSAVRYQGVWEIRPSCGYEYVDKTHYSVISVDGNSVTLKTYRLESGGFALADEKVLKQGTDD
ncbi:MAG: metallophosphoesterase [Chlorobi bacterium]|nr:metallophosphoesterase [Chlorobiota bacterium]